MVEEPAKPCPCIFSHPGINSWECLCLQCYIYMEQPYGIGMFLLTAALLPSKQQREGLLQNNVSCISVSLQIPPQLQRQHLPQCNPSASPSSQGPAGGTCCCVLAVMPQAQTSDPTTGSWPITHLSILWGVNHAHVCPSIDLMEDTGFKVCSWACPSFRTLSFPRAVDKNKLSISVMNMVSSETADLYYIYLNFFKKNLLLLFSKLLLRAISEPPLISFTGFVYRKGFLPSFLTANTRSEPHLISRETNQSDQIFGRPPPWVFYS